MALPVRVLLVLIAALATGDCRPGGDEPAPTTTTTTTTTAPPPVTPGVDPRLVIAVDARIELLSIVSRLAGYPEYATAARTPYARAVDAHFATWREHPAVAAARVLRGEHGIGFNAPIGLALYLDDQLAPKRSLTTPLPALDARWNHVDLATFVTQLQDFARVSELERFLAEQATFRAAVEAHTREALEGYRIVDWFDAVFGPRPATFRVIPGLLTGKNSYAASAVDDDGGEEIAQILSLPAPGDDGVPRPDRDTVFLLVHEFAHSYVNPAMLAHADQVAPIASLLFARVQVPMTRQNYPEVAIMVNESVVRALVVLYARDRGAPGADERQLHDELRRSFLWTRELADALAAVRAANGGRLPPAAMAEATRATFAAWLTAHPP